jgi:hypothetical protein
VHRSLAANHSLIHAGIRLAFYTKNAVYGRGGDRVCL